MLRKKINTLFIYGFALALLLSTGACRRHPHGAPPGQVKKVTGVHPITGKPNQGKATAPGQQKKRNNNGRVN
ncbi:hypothetical protein [Rhodoflexus sp.]